MYGNCANASQGSTLLQYFRTFKVCYALIKESDIASFLKDDSFMHKRFLLLLVRIIHFILFSYTKLNSKSESIIVYFYF